MMTPDTIKKYHLFDEASDGDLAAVARVAGRRHCEPTELVYRQGEEADAIYLIELGVDAESLACTAAAAGALKTLRYVEDPLLECVPGRGRTSDRSL
jgi:hypothetical protein